MPCEYPDGVDACVNDLRRDAPMLYGAGSVESAIIPGRNVPCGVAAWHAWQGRDACSPTLCARLVLRMVAALWQLQQNEVEAVLSVGEVVLHVALVNRSMYGLVDPCAPCGTVADAASLFPWQSLQYIRVAEVVVFHGARRLVAGTRRCGAPTTGW